jgi:hypothetical protein
MPRSTASTSVGPIQAVPVPVSVSVSICSCLCCTMVNCGETGMRLAELWRPILGRLASVPDVMSKMQGRLACSRKSYIASRAGLMSWEVRCTCGCMWDGSAHM